MKNRKTVFVVLLIVFFGFFSPLFRGLAEEDRGRQQIFLILDVSGSMNRQGRFRNVKEYLEKDVFGELLKIGDHFTLILFGDEAREEFSGLVDSETRKKEILDQVLRLKADDDYTDIGGAMEKLAAVLEGESDRESRQIILFITDGMNTPPRDSPYYGKDLALDERFLAVGEKIAKGGWFLYVIGIGEETDAKKIADSVSGSMYTSTSTEGEIPAQEVAEYVRRVDETAQAREEARRLEEERAAAQEEARRRAEEGPLRSFQRLVSETLGLSMTLVGAILIVMLVLILVLLIFFLLRLLRPVQVIVSDNVMDKKDRIDRRLGPWSGIIFNSADAVLPGIGDEFQRVFRLERGLRSFRIRIEDEEAIDEKSPYKKEGVHKLRRSIIELANGNKVRILVRR